MIVVWGSRDDPPVDSILNELATRATAVCHVDESALASCRFDVSFGAQPQGWVNLGGRRIDVGRIVGMYLRPKDPAPGPARGAAQLMLALAATLPCSVVNRPAAGASNGSKPYQLVLIQAGGFDVPDTLVTSDRSAARAFLRKHSRLVYKSLSGVRSIVAKLDPSDESRLADVRNGPVQLQQYVTGLDVRVHVVGERCFACSITSEAIDYRYASATGSEVRLAPFDLPEEIRARLVALARSMDLAVAGVDLRLTPSDKWVCFEVNPSPGFPWYEESTAQPISEAIVDLLGG